VELLVTYTDRRLSSFEETFQSHVYCIRYDPLVTLFCAGVTRRTLDKCSAVVNIVSTFNHRLQLHCCIGHRVILSVGTSALKIALFLASHDTTHEVDKVAAVGRVLNF
jgi:hypothetical protein